MILCSWAAESRALHVFDDVLARIPDDIMAEIRKRMPDYDKMKATTDKNVQAAMYQQAVSAYKTIADILESKRHAIFNNRTTSSCHVHGGHCPCSTFALGPNADCEFLLTLVVAGSTCVAFSDEGLQLGIGHPSFLVWLVFIMELKTLRPKVFIHECVCAFPWKLFVHFLHGIYTITVYTTLCPTMMGHPIRRPRQYVVGHLLGSVTTTGTMEQFTHLFARKLEAVCTGNVFYVAPEADVNRMLHELARRRRARSCCRLARLSACRST